MCTWGTHRYIHVIRRNHPDYPDGWHVMSVDACIADYVQKMNDLGIITIGCCCGHGKDLPQVDCAPESAARLDELGYGYKRVVREYLDSNHTPYTEPVLEHRITQAAPYAELWPAIDWHQFDVKWEGVSLIVAPGTPHIKLWPRLSALEVAQEQYRRKNEDSESGDN